MEVNKYTETAYPAPEEKVIPEHDRMGLVQALTILHKFRDLCMGDNNDLAEALDVIFEWIDNVVILLNRFGKYGKEK